MARSKTINRPTTSDRDRIRLETISLLNNAIDSKVIPQDPFQRKSPFIVIGSADIGEINWCDAKATYTQASMEGGYLVRALQVGECNSLPPSFLNIHENVFSLEISEPDALQEEADEPEDDEPLPAWEVAEEVETRGTWHVGFAARFNAERLDIAASLSIVLVGITDGVLDSGILVEVRQSSWEWSGMQRNRAYLDKETQANLYAVMLGLKSWRCVFVCADGRFVTEGKPDEKKALDDIRKAVQLRLGLEKPHGVDLRQKWKCVKGRCQFAQDCPHSPASPSERASEAPPSTAPMLPLFARSTRGH